MNVSPSAPATIHAHGAHASGGKTGDPLADFMALLGQLGIATDDGAPTTDAPTLSGATPDVTAKMLAKLGKKVADDKKPVVAGDIPVGIDGRRSYSLKGDAARYSAVASGHPYALRT